MAFRGTIGSSVTNLSCFWADKGKTFTGNISTAQELTFDYSTAGDLNSSTCTPGAGLTFPATINGFALNINTSSTSFNDPIYIDYISVGASSPTTGATCQTDFSATPVAPMFVEQFNPLDEIKAALTGTIITNSDLTTSRENSAIGAFCGQVNIQNATGSLKSSFSTVNYDTLLTLSNSDLAVIRIRAKVTNATPVPVRATFRGDVGSGTITNLSNSWSREQKMLPGDGEWHDLVFYFGFPGDLNSASAAGTALTFPAQIAGIGLSFYSASTAVTSPISIDYISIGNIPTSTNCTPNGIENYSIANSIKIFPIPAEDELHFKIDGSISKSSAKIVLMNSVGSIVKEVKLNLDEVILNTSSYESGLYFAAIYNGSDLVKIEKVTIK